MTMMKTTVKARRQAMAEARAKERPHLRGSSIALAFVFCAGSTAVACHRQSAAVAPSPPPPTPAAVDVATTSRDVPSRVTVKLTDEGFVPDHIPAQVGKPITLAVTRKTDRTCAREILFKGEPGKTELPLDKEVEVTYTPKAAGAVAFGCAMGMMVGGTIDVK